MNTTTIEATNPVICEIICACGNSHYIRQNDFSHAYEFIMSFCKECGHKANIWQVTKDISHIVAKVKIED